MAPSQNYLLYAYRAGVISEDRAPFVKIAVHFRRMGQDALCHFILYSLCTVVPSASAAFKDRSKALQFMYNELME